jgi:predicted kinase
MKNKIAVFVCGSGGSGKSTFVKTHLNDFTHIDIDIIYEDLLILNKLGLKIKNFNEDEVNLSSKLFEKSKELNNIKYHESIQNGKNIAIDTIGRDFNIILTQRNYLENLGYTTYMVMMYVDLDICINRVELRERVYKQNITEDSWYLSYNNIGNYKKEFGDKFIFVYNNNNLLLDNFLNSFNILKNNKNLI